MLKKFCAVSFFIVVIFLIPGKVFASDVVINEVFPNPSGSSAEDGEFIELYNKSSGAVAITNWKISDTAGSTSTYTIPDNTLPAGGFISFKKATTGISLNNTGDGVELKNESDQLIDSMSFASTIEDKSWSRIPDGTGEFVNNTNPTDGSPNSTPPPSPTPTPTDVPTPTRTPTPTKTPTSAPTSTPVKTPTPTPPRTPTSTPTSSLKTPTPTQKANSPSPANDPNSDLKLASDNNNNIFNNSTPSPNAREKAQVLGASTGGTTPFIFIGLGLIFLVVCGILLYFQFGDKVFLWRKKAL